ncbi:MAG: hypothetical protein LBT98_01175 [Puniceicoccales bacterium]|jgi:hypothetical protein|nr:hypothetical protein [Puniceicoccales bacterium]
MENMSVKEAPNPNQIGITSARKNVACTIVSLLVGCVTTLGISALFVGGAIGSVFLAPLGFKAGCAFIGPIFGSTGFLASFLILGGLTLGISVFIISFVLCMPIVGAPLLGVVCGLVVIWLFVSFAITTGRQIWIAYDNLQLQKKAGKEGAEWGVGDETFKLLRENSFPHEFSDCIKSVARGALGFPIFCMPMEEKKIMEILLPPATNPTVTDATEPADSTATTTTDTTAASTADSAVDSTTDSTTDSATIKTTKKIADSNAPNLKRLVAQAVYRTMEHHKLSQKSQEEIAGHIAGELAKLSSTNANAGIVSIANALKVEGKNGEKDGEKSESPAEILKKQLLAFEIVEGMVTGGSYSINDEF